MATNNAKTLRIISVILKLCAVIPLLIALGLLSGACYMGNRQYTIVKRWPTVDAEVTLSAVASHQSESSNDAHSTTVYQAFIDFRYTVDGKEYTSPTGRGYSTSDYAEIKGKVDQFAPGTHHAIRYNPANPDDIRDDASFTFEFFMAPLILLSSGLIAAFGGVTLFGIGWVVGRAKGQ